MKILSTFTLLVFGTILIAGGNDWGILGLIPSFWFLLREDREEEEEFTP